VDPVCPQCLSSTAALWFAVAHHALRPWPWIIVGLAALFAFTLWLRFLTLHPYLVGGDPQDRVAEAIRVSEGNLEGVLRGRDFGLVSFGKPPLYSLVLGAGFAITGERTTETAHAITLALSALLPLASFALARRLTRSVGLAFGVGLAVAVAPAVVRDAHLIGYQQIFAVLATFAVERLVRFWEDGSRSAYAAAVALATASAYAYIMGVGVLLAVFGLGLLRLRLRVLPFVLAFALFWVAFPFDLTGSSYVRYFSFSRSIGEQQPLAEIVRLRVVDYTAALLHWEYPYVEGWAWARSLVLAVVPLLFLLPGRWYLLAYLAGYMAPYMVITGTNDSYMVPVLAILLPAWVTGVLAMLRGRPLWGRRVAAAALAVFALTSVPQIVAEVRMLAEHPEERFDNLLRAEPLYAWMRTHLPADSRIRVALFSHEAYIALHDRFTFSSIPSGFHLNGPGQHELSDLLDRPADIRRGAYMWTMLAGSDYLVLPEDLSLQYRGYTDAVDRDFREMVADGAFAGEFRVTPLDRIEVRRGARVERMQVLRVERLGEPMRRPPVRLP